jgi:hydrogenase maturation factor
MHDITEGGVYGAIAEMAAASGLGYVIEADEFKVKDEIADICSKLNIDPAGLISSGSMLMAAAPNKDLVSLFAENGIELIKVGRIIENGSYIEKNGAMEKFSTPTEDELWKFIKKVTNNS